MPVRDAAARDQTTRLTRDHVISRRAFLEAAGITGIGLVGVRQLASATLAPADAAKQAPTATTRDAVAELAGALDYDVERIFNFVSDNVRYEPYSGILRGTRGTLASRAGNSADQALLLAALLDASLLQVRFAVGRIDDRTADALLAGSETNAESIRRHGLEALSGQLPGEAGPDSPPLTTEEQARLEQAIATGQEIASWARDQLERTVEIIEAALDDAGVDVPTGFTPVPDMERARHVWVQVAATADWVDLDPSVPGAGPGATITQAAETLDALPEDMAHVVEVAVIGETLTGEGLEERLLVGVGERADALAGQPVVILNTPPEALTALGVSVAGALDGGDSYVPTILFGDQAIVGAHPIRLTDTPADEGQGDDFLAPGSGEGETTAQWVELTIRSPGAEPVVVRREILDRIGKARRAGGRISAAELAPVARLARGDSVAGEALPALSIHSLVVSTGLPSRHDAVMSVRPDEDIRDGSLIAQTSHLLTAATGMELAVPAGVRPFIDTPNVIAHSLITRAAADGDHGVESVVDIWHRSYGIGPVADQEAVLPPSLVPGVLAHVAERILGGEAVAQALPGVAVASVGAVFDRAHDQGIPLRLLRGSGATAGLPWGDDARTRLEDRLSGGWLAIAPERPLRMGDRDRVGWWLVDPLTGRAVDELDDGRGEEGIEYQATMTIAEYNAELFAQRLARKCMAGVLAAVNAFLLAALGGVSAHVGYSWVALLGGGGAGGMGGAAFFLLKGC